MTPTVEPRSDIGTAELVKEALDEARALIKTEITLARAELLREARGLKLASVAFGITAALGTLGIALLLVAFAIGTFPNVWPSLIAGIVLCFGAGIGVFMGIVALPKRPLHETRARLTADVDVLRERTT